MLTVKTKLLPSKINGLGLFAAQSIPQGTLVQKFVPGIDLEITRDKFAALDDVAKRQILHYAYKHQQSGNYILCADDTRFLNHSENPNLISDSLDEEIDIAARDIAEGEELTVNYKDFDADWRDKLEGTV